MSNAVHFIPLVKSALSARATDLLTWLGSCWIVATVLSQRRPLGALSAALSWAGAPTSWIETTADWITARADLLCSCASVVLVASLVVWTAPNVAPWRVTTILLWAALLFIETGGNWWIVFALLWCRLAGATIKDVRSGNDWWHLSITASESVSAFASSVKIPVAFLIGDRPRDNTKLIRVEVTGPVDVRKDDDGLPTGAVTVSR